MLEGPSTTLATSTRRMPRARMATPSETARPGTPGRQRSGCTASVILHIYMLLCLELFVIYASCPLIYLVCGNITIGNMHCRFRAQDCEIDVRAQIDEGKILLAV